MLILLSNFFSWLIILGIILVSYYFTYVKNKHRKGILTMVLVSFFVTISVILTNVVSYNLRFLPGSLIQFSFGSFLIFVAGMLFGPFFGSMTGLAADLLGSMININGPYCAIFTLDAVLYGFVGSLAFLFYSAKWWYFQVIIYYFILFMVISFGLDLLYDYMFFGSAGIIRTLIVKAIKFNIEVVIYLSLIFSVFTSLHFILNLRMSVSLWCDRLGKINLFTLKKSLTIKC